MGLKPKNTTFLNDQIFQRETINYLVLSCEDISKIDRKNTFNSMKRYIVQPFSYQYIYINIIQPLNIIKGQYIVPIWLYL